jgi:ferritin-like metal-binding protein YciE
MDNAFDFFVHELRDMLNAESRLVLALSELESESKNEQLRSAFGDHKRQTEMHAKRLADIFRMIGEQPEQSECKGIKGLIEEKQAFAKERPTPDLLDFFNLVAGIKAERYEISSYRTLLSLARALGLTHSVELLEQNLNEEQEALKKLQGFVATVRPLNLGLENRGEQIERKIA